MASLRLNDVGALAYFARLATIPRLVLALTGRRLILPISVVVGHAVTIAIGIPASHSRRRISRRDPAHAESSSRGQANRSADQRRRLSMPESQALAHLCGATRNRERISYRHASGPS